MRQAFLILILATPIFLISCNNDRTGKTKNQNGTSLPAIKSKDFKKYIESLDLISLPLNHNPMGKLPKLSEKYDKNDFEKFKHVWTSKPLGLLFKNDQSVVTIELSIGDVGLVPFIISYDLNGNKVDSLGPYKKSGQDIGYFAIEYLTITNDRLVTVIDTVKRWKLNPDQSDIIEDSLKITSEKIIYRILDNGTINKEK